MSSITDYQSKKYEMLNICVHLAPSLSLSLPSSRSSSQRERHAHLPFPRQGGGPADEIPHADDEAPCVLRRGPDLFRGRVGERS